MKRRIYISHLDDALRRISIILPLVCSFCGAHAGAQTRPSVTVSPSTTVPSILGCRNFSGLVCAGIPSFAAQNGMSPDWTDIYNALQLCASEGSSTAPCTVFLTPGSYYLTKTLQIPSNTILSSTNNVLGGNVTLYRDWADVPGEGQYMGPVISMSGTNVTIEHLAINGLDHPFYSGDQSNNVNVLVQNCINCVVEGVDSSHSRVASIRVMDGNQYLSITGCAIHDNGQPGVDASGNSLRSDGLAVTRVAGTSSIQSNTFWNNTDMNLILGGGMTGTSLQPVNLNNPPATLSKVYCSPPGFQNPPGLISMCMSVINNIIYADNASNANINQGPLARPVNSALLLDRSGLTGAGIMFDNEDGWSPNCQGDAPNSTPQNPVPSCADFTGFYINGNTSQCGTDCGAGIAVGTGDYNYLPVTNLWINSSNSTDYLVVHYTGQYNASSYVPVPTVNIPAIAPAYSSGSSGSSCWFNHSLTWAYTVNGPCQACQTLDPSDPNHQRTLCGIQDSGFKLPTLLTTFVADSDSPTPLSRSRGTAILPAEDVWITPMISTPSPTCVTSDPQNVTCSATPLSGTYPIPNPLDNNLAASPFTIAVNVSANAPLGEYVTVTLSQTYNLSTTSTATAAASAPFFITP